MTGQVIQVSFVIKACFQDFHKKMMSLVPTNACVSRETIVEIITLGIPTRKLHITPVPRVVQIESPRPMTP